MTLIQLEYIVALDNFKNFAKAAAHCHITQPSLSMQVKKLEEELGIKLFVRSSPVLTTETGHVVVEQAKNILAATRAMNELVQLEKDTVSGTIRIGIIPTLAPYLLPFFVQPFIRQYPQVRLTIHEFTTEQIIKQVKNGSVDAGILATPLNVPDLREHFLFNEEFVAYVSRKEKLFSKRYILPGEIDIHRMWLLEEGHCLRNQVMNLCSLQKDASIEKHFDYAAGSIETLRNFVDKNGGITLLPELATYCIPAYKENMLRYFKHPAPVREISLVTAKAFPKMRLLNLLKHSILEHLPLQLRKKKKVEIVPVN